MSRSGYVDDCENLNLYRGRVDRSLKGKRGQAFLRELIASLDAMPVKELIAEELVSDDGACCAVCAVCKARGIDTSKIDYEDPRSVGESVGIAPCMAAEIEYMNDEWGPSSETSAQRWQRMRKWAESQLCPAAEQTNG